MGLNQICKIGFQFLRRLLVRAAVIMIPDAADDPGIGINGFLTFALKREHSQMTFIKTVKPLFLFRVHGILFFLR
jgi:hypothetical protein